MTTSRPPSATAFSLLEMVVVVAVLVALAGFVLPRLGETQDAANQQGTATTLQTVRNALVGADGHPSYLQDVGNLPPNLAALFTPPVGTPLYDPVLGRGWHGPYLLDASSTYQINTAAGFTTDYGAAGDPAPSDAWHHSIILQIPTNTSDPAQQMLFARLVSAGPDGVIQTPDSVSYPTPAQRGDDVVLFLMRPDIAP